MNETYMIISMVGSVLLFTIGGTGWKPARRYGIPLLFLAISLITGVLWWKASLMALSLIVALSMGYGEGSPYWKKAITFSLYGLSFLWIGFSWWIIITPCLCLLLFWLSNNKNAADIFNWKFVEGIYGILLGITFSSL